MNITDLLVLMQRIGKMHEQMLKELCRQYDLSLIEAKIIAFLHNNPTKDTAGDIVELRLLQSIAYSGFCTFSYIIVGNICII